MIDIALLFIIEAFYCLTFFLSEAATEGVPQKKVFLKISKNSQENTCDRASSLIKFQPSACNYIQKETLTQVLSGEFCE